MTTTRGVQDIPPFTGYSLDQEHPLGGYAVLTTTFAALAGSFAYWLRVSRREVPARMDTRDLVLVAIATHKTSRLIAKDRVSSTIRAPFTRYQDDAGPGEVTEAARGTGLRRAIGELIICPYCLGLWIAAAFTAGLLTAPRATRWTASVLVALTGSDAMQLAYTKAEDTL